MLDTHTAVWSWGDGTSSAGTVTRDQRLRYGRRHAQVRRAGLYMVSLKVIDKDGGVGTFTATLYVVVYNPCKGCV